MPKLSSHYEGLLYRYACRIIKHKLVAIIIVEDVSRQYMLHASTLAEADVRTYLRMNTLEKCMQWLEAKGNVLKAREPKDPT
jgi:hypothetical protein